MPDVAVIIPCYNAEKFIERALRSVAAQTLAPAQVLVIDDGSQDRSCELIEKEFPSVRVIRQQNGGPARARNAGLHASHAPLVAFLDADDWWEPGKLAAQAESLCSSPSAVANYTAMRYWDEPGGGGETWAPSSTVRRTNSGPGCAGSIRAFRRPA